MNRSVSTFFFFLICITIFYTPLSILQLRAVEKPYIDGSSAVIIDAKTGSVLFGQDEHEQFGIASITKLMTVYVFLKEAEEQGIKLDDVYNISYRASVLRTFDVNISGVYFYEGQQVTVEELLNLALVYSDNGAAVELAEIASGTEKEHVEKMNKQAEQWGMEETIFYNASGLTMYDYGTIQVEGTSSSDYNVSSSADVATMAYHIIQDYPEVLDITSKNTYHFNNEDLPTWNLMLPDMIQEYPGVSGLKTGSSDEAHYCFTAFFEDEDQSYITVVLGTPDDNARFTETSKLLDYIKKIDLVSLIDQNYEFTYNINGDKDGDIILHPNNSLLMSSEDDVQIQLQNIKFNSQYFDDNEYLIADIPKEEVVMTLEFKVLNDSEIGFSKDEPGTIDIDLISNSNINKLGFFGETIHNIIGFFLDLSKTAF